jgi:hypothetical protein
MYGVPCDVAVWYLSYLHFPLVPPPLVSLIPDPAAISVIKFSYKLWKAADDAGLKLREYFKVVNHCVHGCCNLKHAS